jgi:hypothetical protein
VDKGVMNDIEEGLRLLERSGTLGNDSTSARSAKEAVAALVKHVLAARGKSSPFSDMSGDSMGTAVSLTANAAIEELQRLRRENSNLEQRIRSLEATGSVSSSSGSPAAERALQTRCDVLVREREAVQTIMEQKIKVLVQSVAHAVGAVLQTSPQAGGSAGHALSKVSLQATNITLHIFDTTRNPALDISTVYVLYIRTTDDRMSRHCSD